MKKSIYVLLALGALQLDTYATDNKENKHPQVKRYLADHETLDNLDTFEDIRTETILSPLTPAPLNITWTQSFDPEATNNTTQFSSEKTKITQKENRFLEDWETYEQDVAESSRLSSQNTSTNPQNKKLSRITISRKKRAIQKETTENNQIELRRAKFKQYLEENKENYPAINLLLGISDTYIDTIFSNHKIISNKEALSNYINAVVSKIRESDAFNSETPNSQLKKSVASLADLYSRLNEETDNEPSALDETRLEVFMDYFEKKTKKIRALGYLKESIKQFPLMKTIQENELISDKDLLSEIVKSSLINLNNSEILKNKDHLQHNLAKKLFSKLEKALSELNSSNQ